VSRGEGLPETGTDASGAERGRASVSAWSSWRRRPQILPETSRLHLTFQDSVGGCDDSHVDTPRVFFADALELPFLEYPEELGLERRRNFSYFVQEQRPAIGQLKASRPIPDGAGKRALDVAEEFTLEEVGMD